MKPPIYLDYDDVLVDFNGAILRFVNTWNDLDLSYRDVITYSHLPDTYGPKVRELWQRSGLYDLIDPFPTSRNFLKVLQAFYNVTIVTKSADGIEYEKEHHAKKHFGYTGPFIHVGVEGKAIWTIDGPLIDDAKHNIEPHVTNNNKVGILFNMNGQNGWSRYPIINRFLLEAQSHQEVLELLGI